MLNSYDEIEARIQAALASISRKEKSNIAKLAWDYTVPISRLRARFKRQNNRLNCGRDGHIFTDAQEQALILIIKYEEVDETYLHH